MQVKKFEARSVKAALEMVKKELGPEAIILSVKDNNRGFGLVGEGSIEITAAIPDTALRKKHFAESRMNEQRKEKFQAAPARTQRATIDKAVSNYTRDNQPRKPMTSQRYIDIDNENEMEHTSSLREDMAQTRIKSAAQRAWAAMRTEETQVQRQLEQEQQPQRTIRTTTTPQASQEVLTLRQEVQQLKDVIEQFKKVPQTFVSNYPGGEFGLPYELSSIFQKLTLAGIDQDTTAEILTEAEKEIPRISLRKKSLVEAWVAKYILRTTQVVENENANSRIHLFMGPAGHGKTSTLIKMASHMVIREGKRVAILTADTDKVGATEQMRIYSQILNIPFAIVRTQEDWRKLASYTQKLDAVLVDLPGCSLKNAQEIDRIRELMPPTQIDCKKHLVISATSKEIDAMEMGRRYRMLHYTDVIFTRLDESLAHGMIYSFQKKLNTALHSFGVGSRVPEDFERATKERVLDLIFKLTQLKHSKEAEHAQ